MTRHLNTLTVLVFGATTAIAGAAVGEESENAYFDDETVDHVEVGSLSCDVGQGSGFVFGSSREMVCTFNPVQEGLADETYVGQINRYGIDIGKTENGRMSWLVLAPTEQEFAEGGLNGTYRGVSAEVTAGVGVGANLMTGGSENTLALQPLSLNTQNGVNLALGVGEIELQRVSG